MQDHNLLTGHQWQPFTNYGFTHKFWTLDLDTVVATVMVTTIIILISLYAHYVLQKKESIAKIIILKYVETFKDLVQQALQFVSLRHLAFIGSLFTFIFFCNIIAFIPFIEEPTKDLNTTLALGLISFFYVQSHAIAYKGLRSYIMDFFEPFFLMLPLNIIGTLTSIISLSFRLFGNIFGGYVISSLYAKMIASSIIFQCLSLLFGLNLILYLIFGLCEGLIQAFVFTMLTLTYLSMEIVSDEEAVQT